MKAALQIPEIVDNGGDLQIFVSPNTAWNGIQQGQTVIPRFAGTTPLDTTIAIWKPNTAEVGGTVNFWNTDTEQNISLRSVHLGNWSFWIPTA